MDKIIKILDSVLLSICACAVGLWLYWIFEPWLPFCKHHPGIVLVVIGFIGATLFGYEKTTKFRKRLEWWCEIILLVGLLLEMREAVNEDSKILALQKQLNWRDISQQQINDFIILTQNMPKFPIRVGVNIGDNEAFNYAFHIKKMLNSANYPTPNSDTNFAGGVFLHDGPDYLNIYDDLIGDTNGICWVVLLTQSTNNYDVFHYSSAEYTNGFKILTINPNDTNSIFGAIRYSFENVKISLQARYLPTVIGTNMCEIFVMQKSPDVFNSQ